MRNFGECPSAAVESRLSWILEAIVHPKYYLTDTACRGILRRANRRGKGLPPELQEALEYQAEHYPEIIRVLETVWEAQKEPDGEKCISYAVRIRCGKEGGGKGALVQTELSGTLGCNNDQAIFCAGFKGKAGAKAQGIAYKEEISPTIIVGQETHCICIQGNCVDRSDVSAKWGTGGNNTPFVCGIDCRNATENEGLSGTLQAHESGGFSLNCISPVRIGSFVRLLTPLECERLQGYPDGWTDIGEWTDSKGKRHKESSDSARYKACGNSIALPFWLWLTKRIAKYLPDGATLGSLFDGIGGFPFCWEAVHGKGSAVWASEIDEFPMAVTRRRFGKEKEK